MRAQALRSLSVSMPFLLNAMEVVKWVIGGLVGGLTDVDVDVVEVA